MKKPKEVSVSDYKYKSQSLTSGYYYFELEIDYDDFSNKSLTKRYSQIKELYKILILKCPGCLIPKIKSKSLKMKVMLTKEEKEKIKYDVQRFLKYLLIHPILMENNSVKEFFSEENKEINRNQTLNTNKMKTFIENDDDDDKEDDSSSNKEKMNKSDNLIIENNSQKEKEIEGFEIIEKEDYKDLLEDNDENELLNMFLEEEKNKSKGIVSNFINSAYNYIKIYTEENNNELEKNPKQDIKNNLQEKDIEFIKSNFQAIGEDMQINNYGNEIMKMKEAIEYLIQNFKTEMEIIDKKAKSLDNIISFYQEMNNIDNKKNKKEKKEDLNEKIDKKKEENNFEDFEFENIEKNEKEIIVEKENIKNTKEKWDRKIINGDINKIKNYSSLNQNFILEQLNPTINKMLELKDILEGLRDIYNRKKNHINFLGKLNSKYNEKKKIEELAEEDGNKKNIVKDINFFKKKIELEKSFINKLNQNLKYEINKFKKEKENSIYILINDLFKNHYLKECEIYDVFNKEISFDSDSENSSKLKVEERKSGKSGNDSDQFFIVEDNNKTDKEKEDKDSNKNRNGNNSWDGSDDEF